MSEREFWDDFARAPASGTTGGTAQPVRASTLAGQTVRPVRWVVDEMVPQRTVTLLSGDGGLGKSWLAMMLAMSVVLGRAWLGRATVAGSVFYFSAEDELSEVHRRLDAIARVWGVDLADLDPLRIVSLAEAPAVMAAPSPAGILAPTPLFSVFETWVSEDPPALVVVDTVADTFGGNENDRAQVRQFVGMLRGFAIRNDCAVLILSHPSIEGMRSGSGLSGSTAWNNSVRARLYLSRPKSEAGEPDPDARLLAVAKSNYGRAGDEIALRWADGIFETDTPSGPLDRAAADARADRIFLELLAAFTDEGRVVGAANSRNYAPTVMSRDARANGLRRAQFEAAMTRLFARKKIRIERDGPPSRQRERVVLANGEA